MSWFNPKNEEISESELIAYHLHELPPRRERAVARALEASAALAADSASVSAALCAVQDTPGPIDQAAFTRVWTTLRPALQPYTLPLAVKPRWQTPALAGAGLAALAAVTVWAVVTRHQGSKTEHASAPSANIIQSRISAASSVGTDSAGETLIEGNSPLRVRSTTTHQLRSWAYRSPLQGSSPAPLSLHIASQTAMSWPSLTTATSGVELSTNSPVSRPIPTSAPLDSAPSPALAVDGGRSEHGPRDRTAAHGTDVMLALGGTFIGGHSSLTAGTEARTFTATNAIAAVGAFHQQFRPALGYRVTLSYTRPELDYSYLGPGGGVNSRIFEAAGTYVLQGPHHRRLSTAVDAGVALMAFLPTVDPAAHYVYRAAGVLGASAQYAISKHWAARATYRAQIFRTPDFRYTGYTVPVATSLVVSHEPSLGIVYRFGNPDARNR